MDWETLDKLIDELEGMIDSKVGKGLYGVIVIPIPSHVTWGAIWAKAAEVQNGFKGVRYPTKAEREDAWQRFNSLRDEASKRRKEENDARRWESKSHRSEILRKIESARPSTFLFHQPDVEEMKALGRVLWEAGQMLSQYKREMLGEHKQECFDAIQDMRKVHDAWWAGLDQARCERRQDRQARIRSNLERNYERYRNQTQALENCRSCADDLRSKIASAWNDNWASDAEGRLSELEDKIADIERSIEQIEEWIREDESKLE
jgi:hypothetical protein